MKKVLFDFTPFQDGVVNGGALYTKIVLNAILEKKDVEIVGMALNPESVNYELFGIETNESIEILKFDKNIFDYANKNVSCVFVAISQRYNAYDLTQFNCRVIVVCHDLFDFSLTNAGIINDVDRLNYINNAMLFKRTFKSKVKKTLLKMLPRGESKQTRLDAELLFDQLGYQNFNNLIKKDNVYVVTVSEYSKNCLLYYFRDFANEITVLYPPETINNVDEEYHNPDLNIGKDYFLLLSCNRYSKNSYLFERVFRKWNQMHSNKYAVVFIGIKHSDLDNSYCFTHVSDKDLVYLIKNCYALVYPSFAEGFGYPPIEVMKFSKPVLAAYDTSIPEICGDGALFFNPLYEEDLFFKQNQLIDNYDVLAKKAKNRYIEVSEKQNSDLKKLIELIKGK